MLTVGQVLQKRYQLRQQLRAQPTRQTWLAIDRQTTSEQKLVVIKFLAFGRGMAWDEMKLFEREVEVLQQLNHPQIPQYLDSFHIQIPDPWLGLIEEYIPGKSLQTLVEEGRRCSESDIYDWASQVLEILIYLHEQNPPILHRDIKPSNLILTPSHVVFLVDFGAVQSQWPQTGVSFTVVGTYGYTPLEQFGGQAVPASDLYSLGASLLHLLTGLPPAELAQPDLQLQFRDRITLSNHLATWLERMTAPALADRFDTARAALSALTPLNSSESDLLLDNLENQRLQIHANPKQLQVLVRPIWSAPLTKLQDLAGITLLTLLEPLIIISLALLPFGLVYTRQALASRDIGGISIGVLLICLGSIPWVTGLHWLKQNLTSTLIESFDHRLFVKYQFFGWTYWQQSQPNADITNIYAVPLTTEDLIVMVNFKRQASLALANNLNLQESQILIQTLQQWLDHHG